MVKCNGCLHGGVAKALGAPGPANVEEAFGGESTKGWQSPGRRWRGAVLLEGSAIGWADDESRAMLAEAEKLGVSVG